MSSLHRPWQCHVLCRCTVRSFVFEGESHTMELHGMQLTLIPELAGTADVAPLPFAKPRSARCTRYSGRLHSTPRGVAVRHFESTSRRSTRAPTPGAYTPAGENVGKASRAPAGLTAEAGSTIAQRPTVCSPRRPNSRQRRSANRLVDFIRAKQASYTAIQPSYRRWRRQSAVVGRIV